jgi:polar amino acid transport system substrate-binding protein
MANRVALLFISLMAGAMAHAAEDDIRRTATYTVGVEQLQYYPLHSTANGNQFSGFAREVLDAFARQQGYSFRYIPLPINRLYTSFLKTKSVDFKYPDNPKWQDALRRSHSITYSSALVTSDEGALVLPENKGRPLAQIKSLGTVLGFTPWPYRTAIDSKAIAVSHAGGFGGLFRHALAGHIDAVYVNVDVANYLLTEELGTPGGLVFDPGLPYARSDFCLSTLQHPRVVEEFDRFLKREQALLQTLREKYKIEERGLR